MKNITNKEFEINKTTMRDLTPYEVDQVAGGSITAICPFPLPLPLPFPLPGPFPYPLPGPFPLTEK